MLVDQIEFSNVIIINKVDTVGADTRQRIRALVSKLTPQARILEAKYGRVDPEQLLNTSIFDFEKAATGMGWLQSLHEMSKREIDGKVKIAPKPETAEDGMTSFVHQARRPFQSKRLYELIRDKFVLMEGAPEEEDDEAGSDEEEEPHPKLIKKKPWMQEVARMRMKMVVTQNHGQVFQTWICRKMTTCRKQLTHG